jgi:hypothetical protein
MACVMRALHHHIKIFEIEYFSKVFERGVGFEILFRDTDTGVRPTKSNPASFGVGGLFGWVA